MGYYTKRHAGMDDVGRDVSGGVLGTFIVVFFGVWILSRHCHRRSHTVLGSLWYLWCASIAAAFVLCVTYSGLRADLVMGEHGIGTYRVNVPNVLLSNLPEDATAHLRIDVQPFNASTTTSASGVTLVQNQKRTGLYSVPVNVSQTPYEGLMMQRPSNQLPLVSPVASKYRRLQNVAQKNETACDDYFQTHGAYPLLDNSCDNFKDSFRCALDERYIFAYCIPIRFYFPQ